MQLIVLNPPTHSVSHKETRRTSSWFAAFKLRAATLLLLFGCLFTGNLYAEPPECSMGACDWMNDDWVCFELLESKCTATVLGNHIESSGLPWVEYNEVDSVLCDACCNNETVHYEKEYMVESSWSYCITLGTSVEIKIPWVSGWTLEFEGQACYKETRTDKLTIKTKCSPGTANNTRIVRLRRPTEVTTRIRYSKWVQYGPRPDAPDGCDKNAPIREYERDCTTTDVIDEVYEKMAEIVAVKVDCAKDENGDIICPQ